MQLSKDTIAKLKNFATINPNLVYKGDGRLTTISEVKNILAETNITEDIKTTFGIYDLTEFLSALSLIPDGDVTFTDTAVEIKGGGAKLKYTYADTNILTAPTKTIDMPPADVTVVLTAEQIDAIRKAASTLGHNVLRFEMYDNNKMSISAVDSTGASKNTYSIDYDTSTYADNVRFKFDILINNLKLTQGQYTVYLSHKLISKWEGETTNYFIALEQTSTFENGN